MKGGGAGDESVFAFAFEVVEPNDAGWVLIERLVDVREEQLGYIVVGENHAFLDISFVVGGDIVCEVWSTSWVHEDTTEDLLENLGHKSVFAFSLVCDNRRGKIGDFEDSRKGVVDEGFVDAEGGCMRDAGENFGIRDFWHFQSVC